MATLMIADRRKKNRALVEQQKHRRASWWNQTPERRAAHLGWCKPCQDWYRRGSS